MAVIEDIIYKLETPTSETDSNYEDFEFMLGWYGRDGEYIEYLFTDWEQSSDVDATPLNLSNEASLSSIISSEEREARLTAEDLSLNNLKVLSSIFVAKKIIRIFKDGTSENVAIVNNSLDYRQTDGRYNLRFDIALYEKALPK